MIIIFWEISEIIDSFQYRIDNLTDKEINELANKVKSEIDIVINNLKKTKIILFNKFSGIVFSRYNYKKSNLEKFSNILNNYLEKNIKQNINLKLVLLLLILYLKCFLIQKLKSLRKL